MIERVPYPNATQPLSNDDWRNIWPLLQALFLRVEEPIRISGGSVVQGSVFQIGGDVYRVTGDETITGSESDYVKITPDGEEATAEYVANLFGVTWNKTYNGYYDATGNLYVFNEQLALLNGDISAVKTKYLVQDGDSVYIDRALVKIAGGINLDANDIHTSPTAIIKSSFSTPSSHPRALAVDPSTGNLISCDYTTDLIYIHSGISVSVLSSFATPGGSPTGIAIDPSTGNLISSGAGTDLIYIHDGISVSVLSSFAVPAGNPMGLAVDPSTGNLISSDYTTDLIYIHYSQLLL
jgi:DNA-binding beta-propeller fold protein YncE